MTQALSLVTLLCSVFLSGCRGPQSALDPAGREAELVAQIFAWMAIGAAVIWATVIALSIVAARASSPSVKVQRALVVGGGVIVPLVVLTSLLFFGLSQLPSIIAPAAAGSPSIEVTGTQWWWRVRYTRVGLAAIELANELRIPVNQRVDVHLESRDVVHSFWIPPLAGKIDLIPGRRNLLPLQPTRTGVYRGACAEFCGASHARMNFVVVVTEQDEFDAWLRAQAQPATPAVSDDAARGEQLFVARGCAACHTVRGTAAQGRAGPDLTHVASRYTLAAGTLPFETGQLRRWIATTRHIKPEVYMPPFAELDPTELDALTSYLAGLK